jgi:hypothetical protein
MGMLDGKHGNLSCFKYVFAFMSQVFFVNQFINSLNDSFVLHVCCSSLSVLPVSHLSCDMLVVLMYVYVLIYLFKVAADL